MNRFDSPRLKLTRAKRHIGELDQIISEFLALNPYKAAIEADPDDPSFYIIRFKVSEAIPEQVPLVFGDAIHNLRSTLDHLACDLVRLNKGSDHNVYFPIIKSAADLEDHIQKQKVNRASGPVLNAIIALQPYDGGNWGLAMLHALDIYDKHRLVIATGQISTGENASVIRVPEGTLTLVFPIGMSFKDGQQIARTKSTRILAVGETLGLPFDVSLDESFGLGGHGLCKWLRQLADYVEDLIKAFELLCFGGAAFRPPATIVRPKPPIIIIQ